MPDDPQPTKSATTPVSLDYETPSPQSSPRGWYFFELVAGCSVIHFFIVVLLPPSLTDFNPGLWLARLLLCAPLEGATLLFGKKGDLHSDVQWLFVLANSLLYGLAAAHCIKRRKPHHP